MTTSDSVQRQFPCRQCGANLHFEPGQSVLKCPYCQVENEIHESTEPVQEQDFLATLRQLSTADTLQETLTVKCQACGAESTLKPDVTADRCPFCGSAIVAQGTSNKSIRPKSLLPFHITHNQAMTAFRQWLASLWFAPGDLYRFADANPVKGVYIPYWTYDCETDSAYHGERGDNYTEIQHYTVTVNGRTERRTRTVTKIRWRSVSGQVSNAFDDILILASQSLPRKYTEQLEPWDLQNLVPYVDEYLAGFVTESYQIGLENGFELAKGIMDEQIRATIRRDIGGDHQRIHSVNTHYDDITYKHILLPLWISAYQYRSRTFRFLVNARTGEVTGERPYSAWKIFFLILFILLAAALVILFLNLR